MVEIQAHYYISSTLDADSLAAEYKHSVLFDTQALHCIFNLTAPVIHFNHRVGKVAVPRAAFEFGVWKTVTSA